VREERWIGIHSFLISNTSLVTAFLALSFVKVDFKDAVSTVIGSYEIKVRIMNSKYVMGNSFVATEFRWFFRIIQ